MFKGNAKSSGVPKGSTSKWGGTNMVKLTVNDEKRSSEIWAVKIWAAQFKRGRQIPKRAAKRQNVQI